MEKLISKKYALKGFDLLAKKFVGDIVLCWKSWAFWKFSEPYNQNTLKCKYLSQHEDILRVK